MLTGKHIADFTLVLIELLSLDVTAEAVRAKVNRKLVISLKRGQFDPKFQVEADDRPIIFAAIVVTDSFHTKKLCDRLSSIEVQF